MNALLIQRRRQALRIVEAALAATPADMSISASLANVRVNNPRKVNPIMPIRNAPKKPKASSKTDAMKALNADAIDTPEADEAGESAPAPVASKPFAGVLRNAAPKPTVSAAAPTAVPDRAPVVDTIEEEAPDVEDAESAATDSKKALVAFDAQVWQWVSDSGAFVHIKTGEARQEDEFLKPAGKGRNEEGHDAADWDAPQDSAHDW